MARSPADIGGLAVWFEADSITGLADGAAVSSWADRLSTTASQSTASRQPTYRANVVNGLPVVRFAGAQRMTLAGAALSFSNNIAGATVFVVAAPGVLPTGTAVGQLLYLTNGATINLSRIFTQFTASAWRGGGRRLDADSAQFADAGTAVAGQWGIGTWALDYANAVESSYLSGTAGAVTSPFQTAGNTSATNSQVGVLGSNNGTTVSDFLNGDLAAVLCFGRVLNAYEQAYVLSCLSDKYAITVAGYLPPTAVSLPLTAGLAAAGRQVQVGTAALPLAVGLSAVAAAVGGSQTAAASLPATVGLTASAVPVQAAAVALPVSAGLAAQAAAAGPPSSAAAVALPFDVGLTATASTIAPPSGPRLAALGNLGFSSTAASSLPVPYPAGVNPGETLALHIPTNGGLVTSPSGWTTIYRESTISNPRGGMWVKVADAADASASQASGSLTVAFASSVTASGQMERWVGVDPTNPLDCPPVFVATSATTDNQVDLPAMTTVTPGAVAVYGCGMNSSGPGVTATGPTGSTEIADYCTVLPSGGGKAGAVYYEPLPVTGDTGPRVITLSGARAHWGAMFALRPATGPQPAYVALPAQVGLTAAARQVQVAAVALPVTVGLAVGAPSVAVSLPLAVGLSAVAVVLAGNPNPAPVTGVTGAPTQAPRKTKPPTSTRWIAQDLLSGQFLDFALPFTDWSYEHALGAAGTATGKVEPRYKRLSAETFPARGGILVPGRTAIYCETDDQLRWGGIVWSVSAQGPALSVEAATFSSYLHRVDDLHGNLNNRGPWVDRDPCDVIRAAWAYAQEQVDGNLGVTVDLTTSPARVGTVEEPIRTDWWDSPNLGELQDSMAKVEGGPEWTDTVAWAGENVAKRLRLGSPRLGRRNTEAVIVSGTNVATLPPIEEDSDAYANTLVGLGPGEGSARMRHTTAIRDGGPRLVKTVQYPQARSQAHLEQLVRADAAKLVRGGTVKQVVLRPHPAAPLGSIAVGDDVWCELHDQWDDYTAWSRVLGLGVGSDGLMTASLELA